MRTSTPMRGPLRMYAYNPCTYPSLNAAAIRGAAYETTLTNQTLPAPFAPSFYSVPQAEDALKGAVVALTMLDSMFDAAFCLCVGDSLLVEAQVTYINGVRQ